jgi:integral membrane protein
MKLSSPIGRLSAIALFEGVSFLLLLGLAMPLKYLAGRPEAVRVVGLAHGLLFVLFVGALAHVALSRRWSMTRALAAFGASLVPFGTFVLDGHLRREEEATASEPARQGTGTA